MAIVLDKQLALKAACVARQAERSVAFGLRTENEWPLMRAYYDEDRMRPVLETTERLEGLISVRRPNVSRESVFPNILLVAVTYPITRLLNCFRRRWRFPYDQIQFLTDTLRGFISDVENEDKWEPYHLVELRRTLLLCHELIGYRLAGVPEFERAMRIEHFCQPDHIHHLTIEEICGPSALVSA
jgi:hypothetical protein